MFDTQNYDLEIYYTLLSLINGVLIRKNSQFGMTISFLQILYSLVSKNTVLRFLYFTALFSGNFFWAN